MGKTFAISTVLLIVAALLIPQMSAFSMWFDEVAVAEAASTLKSPADFYQLEESAMIVHPPLFFLSLKIWTGLVGDSDVMLRALTVFLALVGVALTYRLTLDLSKQVQGGIAAALLLGTMGFVEQYAHTTHNYALVLMLSCALLLCYERYWHSQSKVYLWGIIVTITALIYTHYYASFLILALNLHAVSIGYLRFQHKLKSWILAQVVVGLLYLPWLPVLYQLATGRYADTEQAGVAINSTPTSWDGIKSTFNILLYDGAEIYLVLMLIGAGILLIRRHYYTLHILIAFLGLSLILSLTANYFIPTFNARRMIYLVIGISVLCGYGLATLPRPVFGVALIGCVIFTNNDPVPVSVGANWYYRHGIEYIMQHAKSNDLVYIHFNGPLVARPLEYYAKKLLSVPYHMETDDVARLDNYAWARDRLWVVWERRIPDFDPVLQQKHYIETARMNYPEFNVSLMVATSEQNSSVPNEAIRSNRIPLPQLFGSRFELEDWHVDRLIVSSGQTINIWLTWQLVAPVEYNYSIFVHLIEDNLITLHGQADSTPSHLGRPLLTTFWPTHTPIYDHYTLTVNPDTPAGQYNLRIGVYNHIDSHRLLVVPGDGGNSNDGLIIAAIEVR